MLIGVIFLAALFDEARERRMIIDDDLAEGVLNEKQVRAQFLGLLGELAAAVAIGDVALAAMPVVELDQRIQASGFESDRLDKVIAMKGIEIGIA